VLAGSGDVVPGSRAGPGRPRPDGQRGRRGPARSLRHLCLPE
jgi:hypothetical protein